VVTGTFAHEAGEVLDVRVEGLAEPIGVTARHPFWSEDRKAFVPAADLRPGERLQTPEGDRRVLAVEPRGGRERVYNIEVDADHVYHVSRHGILVHNASARSPRGTFSGIPAPFNRQVRESFVPGTARRVTLTRDITVYRYYGGGKSGSRAKGRYVTPTRYTTAAGARRRLALPNCNPATREATYRIRAGTTIIQGIARNQTGRPRTFGPYATGGGRQIYVPNPGRDLRRPRRP
jgi:hypothetical protein